MLTTIKKYYLLILIILLAFFVRTYKINSYPALNADEAALGYNAYSLLKTGRDEHDISWPLHFKSFGDYKPGGYVYLALPFIATLGLNPLAVRLPNLILSTLSIFILFRLILLISQNKKLALLSALLLAISPWHIHFSRGAWESSTALSFILIAVYYFYRQKLSLSVIFFVLSTYIYHSARIIAPLLLFSLFITNFRHKRIGLWPNKKLLLPVTIGIFLTIPIALSFLHSGGTTRLGGVGITADPGPLSRSEELLNQHANVQLINRAMHNKKVLYLLSWAEKYFSHFDLNFLFINGDEVPRSKVPDMGQLYLLELPFLLIGLFTLLKPNYKKLKSLVLPWLFIAPIASSLTFQAPSALRALSMSIPLIILVSLGLSQVSALGGSAFGRTRYKLPVTILYLFSFLYYLDAYFIHYPKRLPLAWPYGFQQLSLFLKSYPNRPVYVTNKYDQPHILMTFFDQTSPKLVQSQIKLTPTDQYGFSTVTTLGRYHFQKIDWNTIPSDSLIVTSDENTPDTPFYTIDFPNGQKAFKIYLKP